MPRLELIARYLDTLLRTAEVTDYPNALNGVQVDSEDDILRLAAAVDARERTIRSAIAQGANLLLVHHGLFWGGLQPLRGPQLRRVRALVEGRLAVYASHLPLDAHPEVGNNVLLARELGLVPNGGFARHGETDVGVMGDSDLPTDEIIDRARRFARSWGHEVRTSATSPERRTRRWAICAGAGASAETLREALDRQVDTLIVGEGPHWSAIDAEELGITVVYAGHYATETLGVRALAARVSDEFGIPWFFVDAPTGL